MDETRVSAAAAIASMQALLGMLDGVLPGYIEIRSGSSPATVAMTATGDILGLCVLGPVSFMPAEHLGNTVVATANPIEGIPNALVEGVAGWFRAYRHDGVAVIQGKVTLFGQGGAMQITRINIQAGDIISVLSWQVIQPLG